MSSPTQNPEDLDALRQGIDPAVRRTYEQLLSREVAKVKESYQRSENALRAELEALRGSMSLLLERCVNLGLEPSFVLIRALRLIRTQGQQTTAGASTSTVQESAPFPTPPATQNLRKGKATTSPNRSRALTPMPARYGSISSLRPTNRQPKATPQQLTSPSKRVATSSSSRTLDTESPAASQPGSSQTARARPTASEAVDDGESSGVDQDGGTARGPGRSKGKEKIDDTKRQAQKGKGDGKQKRKRKTAYGVRKDEIPTDVGGLKVCVFPVPWRPAYDSHLY